MSHVVHAFSKLSAREHGIVHNVHDCQASILLASQQKAQRTALLPSIEKSLAATMDWNGIIFSHLTT